MNSVMLGQYIPGNSWLHRLDPRNKIIMTIIWMAIIFLIPNIYGMLGCLALYLVIFITTGLPLKRIVKGLKPVLFLLIFTFVLQLIYTPTGTLYYSFKFTFGLYPLLIILGILVLYFFTKKYIPVKLLYFLIVVIGIFGVQMIPFNQFNWLKYNLDIYSGGLIQGSYIFLRIVLMIGLTTLLTASTMSTDINNGLESILAPLKVIKIPVGAFAMIISLTLRFIPLLYEETNKIMKAQASRGVDFSEGNLKKKVTQIISLLIPMFVLSFNKAEDLANAMEVRGYVVGAKRSRLDLLKFRVFDYLTICFTILALAGVIVWNVL